MSRGKQSSSGAGNDSRAGRVSRGPGVSSLNNNKIPPIGNTNSSVAGAGFNSKNPYNQGPTGGLNTNVFNIPKYGSGGLGGGIGAYGSGGLGGGIGAISAARLRSRERDIGSQGNNL